MTFATKLPTSLQLKERVGLVVAAAGVSEAALSDLVPRQRDTERVMLALLRALRQCGLLAATWALLLGVAWPACAQPLVGKVVAVTDGDTIKVLTPKRVLIKVRLVEIDAPEKGQPWGKRSKEALSDLVFSRDVRIVAKGTDRYGRLLGRVYVGSSDVNAELIRQGAAWAYREYLTDRSLLRLESQARSARRGLWSLPASETLPPWEWRKGERQGNASAVVQSQRLAPIPFLSAAGNPPRESAAPIRCGAKRYCREMTSCDEARFYLRQCGLRSIDGDGDGRPCEKICSAR
jgi:endonuclease YncB( thermonuclease family)